MDSNTVTQKVIAVIGLGYVGLPLAVTFGKTIKTIGFDLNAAKIDQLNQHVDITGEVSANQFESARHLKVSANPADIKPADYIVVAVPTPSAGSNPPISRSTDVRNAILAPAPSDPVV